MLALTLGIGESLVFGEGNERIEISVSRISQDRTKFRVLIEAPKHIGITRGTAKNKKPKHREPDYERGVARPEHSGVAQTRHGAAGKSDETEEFILPPFPVADA